MPVPPSSDSLFPAEAQGVHHLLQQRARPGEARNRRATARPALSRRQRRLGDINVGENSSCR